ncbi:hypothetical protein QVD17_00921 [Tagetes erecta]|uniref:Replication factor A C-terminal domain-containing protein n=1 Tax=Tagetes erecta TaxID=13708 RepID=A0AAD8L9K7_TARER|nr:hypothetical protein QVD17_00921 [Tagetes erecta]
MATTRVSEILPMKSPKQLEVRVLKRWRPFTPDPKRKTDMWYLLVDIHGDAIEATCEAKDVEHFSNLLEPQKSFKLNGYVSRPARNYMPMVPHKASLLLGRRVTVEPLENSDIPRYYYNFVRYDDLRARKTHPKPLTGLQHYLNIFNTLGAAEEPNDNLQKVAISDIITRATNDIQRRGKFMCNATISTIHEYRGWFSIKCGDCSKKGYSQDDTFVCSDCDMPSGPVLTYALNTIITDTTASTEAGFFTDALNSLTGFTCKDLVGKGNNNPNKLPPEIQNLIDTPLLLTINIRPNGSVGVDNARRITTISPPTPDPKSKNSKEKVDEQSITINVAPTQTSIEPKHINNPITTTQRSKEQPHEKSPHMPDTPVSIISQQIFHRSSQFTHFDSSSP